MKFNLEESIRILKRTPSVLESYLLDYPNEWIKSNEGKNSWSPYDIVGHLIIGEKTDWLIRINIILNDTKNKSFEEFDRFAQFNTDQNKAIDDLLIEFRKLRESNLKKLISLNITNDDLARTGIHPELGTVTLQQLIATWVVHDLGHIAQISRVMAKQYKSEVGPWIDFLTVLNQ